jgi:RimJ/RimL family protein N-acetyltransferase
MNFDLQPILKNELLIAEPLTEEAFEEVYKAASDPEVWSQHPNKNRYQRSEFMNFFKGAMQSGGAFAIKDKATGETIGSTRFYDLNEKEKSILIGYTFYAKKYWGKNYNHSLKKLMISHALKTLDKVIFHIGAANLPSQRSIEKIGAKKIAEQEVAYYGEPSKLNFVYEITREDFK